MKGKHVILRAIGATTGTSFLGEMSMTREAGLGVTGIAVEVDTLDQSKIPAVRQHRDVVAVAPVMPVKLVQPLDEPGAQPAAAGVDWGITAVGADTSPYTGDGVVVSVLDTGIDKTHPAFAGVDIVQQNFSDDAGGGDQHGHGTHCAGTIFGRDVNGVRIGVARGVKRALIGKVLGANGGSSDSIASAIQWAVSQGANVISMSLGIDFPGLQAQLQQSGLPPELATSRALEGYRLNVLLFERLAGMVRSLGAMMNCPSVIVAAAGNESRRDQNPDFEISVSPPAVAEGIVSVAALGQGSSGFEIAYFSNTGASVSGPGVQITSAKLGGGLTVMSGTSMATPHVAGVAALWGQKQKTLGPLTSALLASRLVGSGDTGGIKKPFDMTDVGAGMVRAPQN
jgi:subtilisin family serine protease